MRAKCLLPAVLGLAAKRAARAWSVELSQSCQLYFFAFSPMPPSSTSDFLSLAGDTRPGYLRLTRWRHCACACVREVCGTAVCCMVLCGASQSSPEDLVFGLSSRRPVDGSRPDVGHDTNIQRDNMLDGGNVGNREATSWREWTARGPFLLK